MRNARLQPTDTCLCQLRQSDQEVTLCPRIVRAPAGSVGFAADAGVEEVASGNVPIGPLSRAAIPPDHLVRRAADRSRKRDPAGTARTRSRRIRSTWPGRPPFGYIYRLPPVCPPPPTSSRPCRRLSPLLTSASENELLEARASQILSDVEIALRVGRNVVR